MKIKGLIIISVVVLLSACNTTPGGLYWGSYSDTLYNYKKEPGDQSRQQHVKSLNDIIATSDKKGIRVPPGVLIELAIMQIESGSPENANSLLDRELSLYPESKTLVLELKKRNGA
ncbi:MAG: hypothetical protein ACI9MS_001169 [Glaciecola sp.]|jgi:hypothetical protein